MRTSPVFNSGLVQVQAGRVAPPSNLPMPMPTGTTIIEPSIHAQRLERILRVEPGRIARPRLAEIRPSPEPIAPQKASWFKKATFMAACICAAAVIPSLSLFMFVGPLGFIAPAALAIACVAFFLLSGKPTPDMEMQMERNRQDLRLWDSRV